MTENAQTIWCKRYASRLGTIAHCNSCNKFHETMEHFLDRISFRRDEFKNLINNLEFIPNSPTLFNAGIPNSGSLSACFVLEVPDSMEGILDVAKYAGMIQKFGGGVGYFLSDVREKGAPIRSTHGNSCGPVAVLNTYHSVAKMITQGGKRQGAQMAVLDADHPDVEEFISCKDDNPQDLNTFNISVRVDDRFMVRALKDENKLLDKIAASAWRTGDPGMIFADTVKEHETDPWMGSWRGVNPCGEQFLPDFGSCNLGSINLMKILDNKGKIDWDVLRKITDLGVKYLDVVINQNNFPIPQISELALERRNIGLGVMGFADLLASQKIHYDDPKAIQLAQELMHVIRTQARNTSFDLASLWGPAPAYRKAPKSSNYIMPRRNTTLISIAPTGTISILAGVSSGIEPHFALENTRVTGDGIVLKEKVESDFIPKTAMEIDWKDHIRVASVFHRYSDTGVSKTINLPNNCTVTDIKEAYIMAWQTGMLAVSLFRDGCRQDQVLNSNVCPECDKVSLVKQEGCSTCIECGYSYCEV